MTVPSRHRTRAVLTVLTLVAAVLALAAPPAAAATFEVTANRITGNPADDDPAPGSCDPGDCSLREAVMDANAAPGADVITFAASGTVALGRDGAEAPATQDLDVTDDLTVEGAGITIDATALADANDKRLLDVDGAGLTVRGATLTGGHSWDEGGAVRVTDGQLTLEGATLTGNLAADGGGAVYLASADLAVSGSTFADNGTARSGGAVGTDDFVTITVSGSTFTGNATGVDVPPVEFPGGHGGAIDAAGIPGQSSLEIVSSQFDGNWADWLQTGARGGAVHVDGADLRVADSWFTGNGADGGTTTTVLGGGISTEFSDQTTVQVENTTLTGNSSQARGGGLDLQAGGRVEGSALVGNQAIDGTGGGIFSVNALLVVTNTTIHANAGPTGGAGVHIGQPAGDIGVAGTAELEHVTMTANDGPSGLLADSDTTVVLRSTILAGHPANCGGAAPTSAGYNLEDADDCGLTEPTDLVSTAPQLEGLADNGGQPQGTVAGQVGPTRALQATSPAVDSADPDRCGAPIVVDQRGVARPQGPECDRGAFELQQDEPPPPPDDGPMCDESAAGAADPPIADGMNRVEGLNRIQTAIVASQAICGDGEAPAVVLTRADLFPDAQAGTPLAIQLGAPLLLSDPDVLSAATETEIERVLEEGGTVYLLGGTAALGDAVADRLDDIGYDTVRYGGINRFETAAIIAEDGLDDPGTLLIANGGDFADSVVAGAASTTLRDADDDVDAAVLLSSGEDTSPETEAYLAARSDAPELIAVGAAAGDAYPTIEEVSGPTRFETALAVADRFFTDPRAVGVARADDFADALTGGAVVGRDEVGPGPMLLTDSDELPSSVETWLMDHAAAVDRVVIFGGEAAVSADVEADIEAALGF